MFRSGWKSVRLSVVESGHVSSRVSGKGLSLFIQRFKEPALEADDSKVDDAKAKGCAEDFHFSTFIPRC